MNTHTTPRVARSFLFILLTIITSVILLSACAQNSPSTDPAENLEEITIAPTLPTNSESPTEQAYTFSFAGVWKYRYSETRDALLILNEDTTVSAVALGQSSPFGDVYIIGRAFWEADDKVFAYGDIVDGEKWFWEYPYEVLENGVQILDGDQPVFGFMEKVLPPSNSDSFPTGVWKAYGTEISAITFYDSGIWDGDLLEEATGTFAIFSDDTEFDKSVLLYGEDGEHIATMNLLGNGLAILDDGLTTYLLQK